MRLLAILACVLWGSAFVGAKIGFEYMEPLRLSGFRFTLAGMLLWPLLFYQKINLRAHLRHWKFMTLFAFLQTFLQYGLFFLGLNLVPAPTAAIIVGAGPLFVAVMAHFTISNDHLSLRKIIAIVLGLSGVIFISLAKGGSMSTEAPTFYSGIFLLILSNLIGGSTNILVAKYKGEISPVALTSFANFTGGILLIAVSLFTETSKGMGYPPEFWGALLWLAIIPAAGFSIWYTLLKRTIPTLKFCKVLTFRYLRSVKVFDFNNCTLNIEYKPAIKVSELNMYKFIIPVTGCVLSWLILPDVKPDIQSIVGIIVITTALIILQYRRK